MDNIRESAIEINNQLELIRQKLEEQGKLSAGQIKFINVGENPNDSKGDQISQGLSKVAFDLNLILNEL